jgi:co-chaperonin GroES (HSP10)
MQEMQIPQNLEWNPSGLGGIYSEKIHLSSTSTALGDNVIIEILPQDDSKNKIGNIILPEKTTLNMDMLKGRISSIGPDAKKMGLSEGDIILYDKWSAYYKPPETPSTFIITNIENIICKVKQEN